MIDYSEIVVGLIVASLVAVLGALIKPFRSRILSLLKYPISMEYESQFETKIGYVFVVKIHSKKNKLISILKNKFSIKIVIDKKLITKNIRHNLMFGEHIKVLESPMVLEALINNRSFGNVADYMSSTNKPKQLFLIVQVKGPGSSNPSLRFQLGKLYKSIKVRIRKGLLSFTYLEIPIHHVTIIASNDKTQIIEK